MLNWKYSEKDALHVWDPFPWTEKHQTAQPPQNFGVVDESAERLVEVASPKKSMTQELEIPLDQKDGTEDTPLVPKSDGGGGSSTTCWRSCLSDPTNYLTVWN